MSNRLLLAALAMLSTGAPARPDLATPRRALRTFIDSSRAGKFDAAASALDLGSLPEALRAEEGPRLARELKVVLDQKLWVDWDRVSDAPDGGAGVHAGTELVGMIPLGAAEVPIRLARSADGSWRIGPGVVAAIPRLYAAYGPGWLADRLPSWFVDVAFLDLAAWQWVGLLIGIALSLFVAVVVGAVAHRWARTLVRRTRFSWDDELVEAAFGPARLLLGGATLAAVVAALHLPVPAQRRFDQLLRIAAVVLFTWVVLRALRFSAEVLAKRVSASADLSAARTRLTQVMILRRIAGFLVVVLGGALVLLQCDALRTVGTSVLASAGVAGIIVGLAAADLPDRARARRRRRRHRGRMGGRSRKSR